jgi:hypothetical protein
MLWEHEANTPGELERVSSQRYVKRPRRTGRYGGYTEQRSDTVPDALAAAKEFFASTELPKSIEWFEH